MLICFVISFGVRPRTLLLNSHSHCFVLLLFCQFKHFQTLSVEINVRFLQPWWRNAFSSHFSSLLWFMFIHSLETNVVIVFVSV